MLKTPSFVVLAFLLFLSHLTLSAQTRTIRTSAESRSNNSKVTAELQRQQKVLQHIAARYEEVSTYDLTPLLKYPYVWRALRENRLQVLKPKAELTAAESRLLVKTYELLEQETMTSFLDHQLSLLTETLDLDEDQQEVVQKILTMDLSDKGSLLSMPVSYQDFQRRLDKISDATEKRILAILFPEQRKVFDRQEMFNRNRLVG